MPVTPNHAAWVEQLLVITKSLPLSVSRRLELGLLMDAQARNHANLARSARLSATPPKMNLGSRFPLLSEVATSGELTDAGPPNLDWGIEVILTGSGVR
jgi:hypothetical protein